MVFLYLPTSKLHQNIYHSCCYDSNWIVLILFVIQTKYETVDDELIETLRIRIRKQTNIVLGVCYTQPDQEEVDEDCKKPHIHRPLSLWGMLTIPLYARREHSRAQAMQEDSRTHR